jgi:hypothetical protein
MFFYVCTKTTPIHEKSPDGFSPDYMSLEYCVLSWEDISDYKQSDEEAEFLYLWKVTDSKKLFYNEPPK